MPRSNRSAGGMQLLQCRAELSLTGEFSRLRSADRALIKTAVSRCCGWSSLCGDTLTWTSCRKSRNVATTEVQIEARMGATSSTVQSNYPATRHTLCHLEPDPTEFTRRLVSTLQSEPGDRGGSSTHLVPCHHLTTPRHASSLRSCGA